MNPVAAVLGTDCIVPELPVRFFNVMDYLLRAVGKQFEQLQDEIAKVRGIEMMSQW